MQETKAPVDIQNIPGDEGFFDEFDKPTKQQWKQLATGALKGAPFDKVMFTKTYENITLQPIYDQTDIEKLVHLDTQPGFLPYVRGTDAAGFVGKPWRICQELTVADPAAFNVEMQYDLARGQDGLTLVLDRASLRGNDADKAQPQDLAGGVSISTADDLRKALEGIDLRKTHLVCFTGVTAVPVLAMLASFAKQQSQDLMEVEGCIGADPIGQLVIDGTLPMSLDAAWDAMASTFVWAPKHASKLDLAFVQGHVYHNAGASSTQEVAFALATGAEVLRQMITRGHSAEEVAPRVRFGLSLGSNFFMEIAKLRAARILWSQLVGAFGASEEAQKLTIHARASAFNKTVYDPHVNMLRITSEGFAGAVGGADTMHLSPFDEPFSVPDRFSRRIARNVQIILRHESHLTQPIDLSAGSYYIESLTDEFARTAWGIFREIEAAGGMVAAVESGLVQKLVAETAAQRRKNVESRKDVVLGTNMYANLLEKKIEPVVVDREKLRQQRGKALADYRAGRDEALLKEKLTALGEALKAGKCGVCAARGAVDANATLGEMQQAMGQGRPLQQRVTPLAQVRGSEAYEKLRQRAELYKQQHGKQLSIFLANMGPIPQHKPRADFTVGFFEISGFHMLTNNGFDTPQAAADAALASQAPIVVICSTDATYPEYVPTLAAAIKAKRPEVTVIVAGKQPEDVAKTFTEAGVDDFIHVRSNCYETNKRLQDKYMGSK